jgi:hypothetical protein
MLFSFIYQGYGPVSIGFSTLSILVGYYFAWNFWKVARKKTNSDPSVKWFLAALLFQTLSSLGTFYLAWMMAANHFDQSMYLGSVYFYLHFQYSGWFFFAIMGLWTYALHKNPERPDDSKIFNLFFIACIPAFLLSVLWAHLPWYIFWLHVAAVILQLIGLYYFLTWLRKQIQYIQRSLHFLSKTLLVLSLFALVIKLFLQAGSVFPEISKMAFGYRSIVIAYLHLVLLAVTSLFLIGYGNMSGWLKESRFTTILLLLFSISVFANELVLTVQGMAGFFYIIIPYLNEALLAISVLLFISITGVIIDQKILKNRTL